MAPRDTLWLQAGSYDAQEYRMLLAALTNARLFTDLAPSSSPLVSAGGGHGVVGEGLVVSQRAGTANMSVDVAAGQAFIRGTQQGDQGVYLASNDATVNVPVATADGANPRLDLIVVRVADAFYGGGSSTTIIGSIAGTPAASPVAPTPPENSLVLAQVSVPAGVASITNDRITDRRTRASALGGTLPCPSSAYYPDPATAGMRVYDVALAQELVHNGTAWVPVSALGAWTSFTPVWRLGPTAITLGNATNVGRLRRVGRDIEFYARLVVGSTTGFPANATFTLDLPVPAFEGSIAVRPIGVAAGIDQSTGAGSRATAEIAVAADRVGFFSGGAYWSGTAPWTWAVDDTLFVVGSYEAAS